MDFDIHIFKYFHVIFYCHIHRKLNGDEYVSRNFDAGGYEYAGEFPYGDVDFVFDRYLYVQLYFDVDAFGDKYANFHGYDNKYRH